MSDSALGYDFPYALDNATKDAAADKIREVRNQSLLEYLINPRDKGENEQTYQDAVGLLRVNAVNESNAKIGDTILLASGVGEIAAAAKAAPVFLKGFFSTTGKTLTEKSSSLVSATRQGAAKAESRATENASVLDDSAETVVSSSSQDAVGNATTTQVEGVVTKGLAGVPGRVQSRINLKNSSWDHVVDRHFNPSKNASQFTVSQKELRSLLQSKDVIDTPVTRTLNSADGIRYVREINVGRNIGLDKFSNMQPTSTISVLTDKFGNLLTATPGIIK